METLPAYISFLFILTTVLTLWFLYKTGAGTRALVLLAACLAIQAVIALASFYTNTHAFPPRLIFVLAPAITTIILLFVLKPGREWMSRLNIKWLTYLHIVRVPVEITLLLLFMNGKVPQLMTFEGSNFDILSGITAPIIAYWGYTKARLPKSIIITWNFVCLVLLFNIVIRAILSVPYPFQKFGFGQPNTALLYFPFIWLPAFVVPSVLFANLVSLKALLVPSAD